MDTTRSVRMPLTRKMATRTLRIIACLLLLSLTVATREEDGNWKNRMLGDAVQMLQGHRDFPPDLAAVAKNEDNTVIPNFMRRLYSENRNRNVPVGGTFANTVRSINSEIGKRLIFYIERVLFSL